MPKSPQLKLSHSNTEELKSKLNYQKEIGYGQLFGYYPKIINTEHGQQVDKLISCKAEVTSDIQLLPVEDLNLLDQPYIGAQTILLTNSTRLTLFILILLEL